MQLFFHTVNLSCLILAMRLSMNSHDSVHIIVDCYVLLYTVILLCVDLLCSYFSAIGGINSVIIFRQSCLCDAEMLHVMLCLLLFLHWY